jgi:hypothetical protein
MPKFISYVDDSRSITAIKFVNMKLQITIFEYLKVIECNM